MSVAPSADPAYGEVVAPIHDTGKGATRVLVMSTLAFTVMFAVWLMFGILGIPIQKELKLTDVELSWITAVAVHRPGRARRGLYRRGRPDRGTGSHRPFRKARRGP